MIMMIKKSFIVVLASAALLISSFLSKGQLVESFDKTGFDNSGDPIIEILDSLVTINNVIRFNNYKSSANQSNPDQRDYIIPQFSDEVYTERISKISTPIPLTFNDEVKKYIEVYAFKKRELTNRVLGLSDLYFPMFEEVFDQEGLPLELKYLSIVESALNPIAKSRVGATGIWQFMYNTGKLYDLKINSYIDERRDPLKATYAASRYFKDMYVIYKDWLLVIAAYNCGAGNVNRAIIRSGGKTDFWEICHYLPKETRGYVPAFIAAAYVMNYASEHKLFSVTPAFSYFEVDTLSIQRNTSLRKIADQVDLPYDVISYLNPIYKRGIIPKSEQPQIIRLPANKVMTFLNAEDKIFLPEAAEKAPVLARLNIPNRLDNNPDELFSYVNKKVKKIHIVKRGETLSHIAGKYDCSTSEIKKLNHLKSTRVFKGQKLKVYAMVKVKQPKPSTESISVDSTNSHITADTALALNQDSSGPSVGASAEVKDNKAPSPEYVYHLVQKGDTLWNIARRYEGVTVEQIIELNKLNTNFYLKAGTKIKVMIAG